MDSRLPPTNDKGLVRITLSGELSVERDGASIDSGAFPGRQGRLVFAYLVWDRRRVERDELADLLWPDRLPPAWERHVSSVVSRLRARLAPVWPTEVVVRGVAGGYELCLASDAVIDVEQARHGVVSAREALSRDDAELAISAAMTASATARRPFLPGERGHWVEERRDDMRRLLGEALAVLADACARRGQWQQAVDAAAEAIELDLYDEEAWARLIRAHGGAGGRGAAARAYERCRALFREELGIDPSPTVAAAMQPSTSRRPTRSHGQDVPDWLRAADAVPLVGRDIELARLSPSALADGPPLVVVTGEPGIGKTRLVAAACRTAADRGMVLATRCLQHDGRPYQPLADLLASHDLAAPVPSGAHPELERSRFFDEVLSCLRPDGDELALVVVEDLHWADSATVLLLAHLSRSAGSGLRLVASYRDTDLSSDATLTQVLADLQREHLLTRLRLAGLALPAVDALTRFALPDLPADSATALARHLHGRTAGNPLFVHELLAEVGGAGAAPAQADGWTARLGALGVPDSVQEMLAVRVSALPGVAAGAVAAAAVLGSEFDLSVVADVAAMSEEETADALDAATRARLLVEAEAPARFRFAHALVQEAIRARLGGGRRAVLHRRAADALTRLGGADDATIAHHLSQAGGREAAARAVGYARRAGDRALGMLDYEAAVSHYELALACITPDDEAGRAKLLLAAGAAYNRAGRVNDARQAFLEAGALARRTRSPDDLAAAALAFGALLVDQGLEGGRVDATLVAILEEALAAVAVDRRAMRARLLSRLSQELHFGGDSTRRSKLADESWVLAGMDADPAARRAALLARHYDLLGSPRVEERLALAEELRKGDPALEPAGSGPFWVVRDLLELGDLVGAEGHMAGVAARATVTRLPSQLWLPALWRATVEILVGDLDRAEALAADALALGQRGRGPSAMLGVYAAQLFAIRLLQGRVGELIAGLEEAARSSPDRLVWRAALAYAQAESGQTPAASCLLADISRRNLDDIAHDVDRPVTLALLAWAAGALGDAATAASVARLLRPYESLTIVVGASPAACAGAAAEPLAVAAATAGDHDGARRWFDQAITMNERLGATGWAARAQEHRQHYLGTA